MVKKTKKENENKNDEIQNDEIQNDDVQNNNILNKKILSFDVGIKNLAYCLIEKMHDTFSIHKWGIINLVDDREKCSFIMTGNRQCSKDANFTIYHKDNENIFENISSKCVCKTHKLKITPKIVPIQTVEVKQKSKAKTKTKKPITKEHEICVDLKCMLCDKNAEFYLDTNKNFKWCEQHYNKNGKAFEKKITAKKISLVNCNKQPIQDLAEKLFSKLDSEPDFLKINDVLIENQPALRNPTMKTISSILYSYFILRGITDKINTHSNISLIKFVSASNKLKVNKEKTDKVLDKATLIKDNTDITVKEKRTIYDLTKNLGKEYCRALIDDKDKLILDAHKKKCDDLCDSFLQGFQYLFSPVPSFYIEKLQIVDVEKKKKPVKDKK